MGQDALQVVAVEPEAAADQWEVLTSHSPGRPFPGQPFQATAAAASAVNAAYARARRVRDIATIDSELRLVSAHRHAVQERGGPLPPIDVADALLTKIASRPSGATNRDREFYNSPCE